MYTSAIGRARQESQGVRRSSHDSRKLKTFVNAHLVKDLLLILPQVLRACPAQDPPSAEYYSRLVAELDEIGWQHLVSMDSMLTDVQLRAMDPSGA